MSEDDRQQDLSMEDQQTISSTNEAADPETKSKAEKSEDVGRKSKAEEEEASASKDLKSGIKYGPKPSSGIEDGGKDKSGIEAAKSGTKSEVKSTKSRNSNQRRSSSTSSGSHRSRSHVPELAQARIGFVSGGRMTESLIKGLLKAGTVKSKQLFVAAKTTRNLDAFKVQGITITIHLMTSSASSTATSPSCASMATWSEPASSWVARVQRRSPPTTFPAASAPS